MKKFHIGLSIALCFLVKMLSAQNYLYNTEQFGLEGAMLGGAITAGTNDISMVYYNPAAIHKITSRIDISLVQPKVSTFGFSNFWGDNKETSLNTDYGLKPSLISFKTKLRKVDIAFLKIGKSDWSDEFSTKRETVNNNIQTIQNFEYAFNGRDNWFGIGTNFELINKLHIGFSQFVSAAKYTYHTDVLVQLTSTTQNSNQPFQYFNSYLNSAYSNITLVSKLGLLYDTEKHDFGLTVTTPAFLRFNRGGNFNQSTVRHNAEGTNIEGIVDPELAPEIKTPWELCFGYSLTVKNKNKLYINASYYTQIADYVMAEIKSFENRQWINGNEAVFNFGLGYAQNINSFLELLGGIRTNKFAYKNERATATLNRPIILNGDHIHFNLGAKFIYKRNTVLIGLDWGTLINTNERDYLNLLNNISELTPNIGELSRNTVNILFTYGFIIDELRNRDH